MQPSTLPIDFSFRLTLASAPFQPLLPRCVSRFSDKSSIRIIFRTLILSCRSFCDFRPFFSIACGLFLQNTGGGGTSATSPRSLLFPFLQTGLSVITCPLFVAPLFSWSYELLFAQRLYFDNYLRCPPGGGVRLSSQPAKRCCSFRHGDIRALCHSSNCRPTPCYYRLTFGPYFPPSTSGTFVCPQTAHVAVDAFPSKLLSICSEATRRAASSPSGPKPSSSAAMAPGSSRPTSSPPNRSWSSAARRLTRRSRPASSARSV